MNSKPAWWGGSAWRGRGFSIAHGVGAIRYRQRNRLLAAVTRETPVVLFLEGIGVALVPLSSASILLDPSRRRRFESGVRLAPVIIIRETIPADVPDALTRRNRNLSPSARSS